MTVSPAETDYLQTMIIQIKKQRGLLFFLIWVFMLLSFSGAATSQDARRKTLTIPVGIYILESERNNDGLSSRRSIDSMRDHFRQVNKIWSQADIVLSPVVIKKLAVPRNLLLALVNRKGRGGIRDFFRGISSGEIEIGNDKNALVWGFYTRSLGGPNGLKPRGANVYFVADNTTVNDARVSSHEIGHVFGLYHSHFNANKLLCLLYTSPSPRDRTRSRMPSSA